MFDFIRKSRREKDWLIPYTLRYFLLRFNFLHPSSPLNLSSLYSSSHLSLSSFTSPPFIHPAICSLHHPSPLLLHLFTSSFICTVISSLHPSSPSPHPSLWHLSPPLPFSATFYHRSSPFLPFIHSSSAFSSFQPGFDLINIPLLSSLSSYFLTFNAFSWSSHPQVTALTLNTACSDVSVFNKHLNNKHFLW